MKLIIMVAVVTITSTSFASGGHSSNATRGRKIVCDTRDDGWEEHWGGHNTCGECLAKHGGCTEICREISYSCTAKGILRGGNQVSAQAVGSDRYQTADEAIRRCQLMGGSDCRSSTASDCNEESHVSSRSTCRRTSSLDLKDSTKIGEVSYLFASHVAKEPDAKALDTP